MKTDKNLNPFEPSSIILPPIGFFRRLTEFLVVLVFGVGVFQVAVYAKSQSHINELRHQGKPADIWCFTVPVSALVASEVLCISLCFFARRFRGDTAMGYAIFSAVVFALLLSSFCFEDKMIIR
jgi:hypothetical protein